MKNEINLSYGNITDGKTDIEITVKGDEEDSFELIKKAIISLISNSNFKHDFDVDSNNINQFVKDILLAATDVIGHDYYYRDMTSNEDKHYNENEELIVSMKAKVELLELIVKNMKKQLE